MTDAAKHYYEAHITIEPVFEERLEKIKEIALRYQFKVADLLLQKRKEDSAERSKFDTFMTGHDKSFSHMRHRICEIVLELKEQGFVVWRYKIEDILVDILVDIRIEDHFNLGVGRL